LHENRLIKETGYDRLFTVINYLFAGFMLLVVLYPLVYVLSASFSSPEALASGKVWLLPVDPGIEGYKAVFAHKNIWTGYLNSLFYMGIGTSLNVVMTVAAAYPLSRTDFIGGKAIMLIFVFTMIFTGGIIPTYLLVNELGLLNSRWALLLPSAMNIFNVVVVTTFFKSTIPSELYDSAKMDGCSNFWFLIRIVLPLSRAVIAVITLFYAVEHWNSFFEALLYLNDKQLFPLQIFLREILLLNSTSDSTLNLAEATQNLYLSELLKYSLIVVSALPMLIIYPFVQKHFVKGVMIGSLKG
jgi:putative aldouronate transport system permease protein